MDFRDGTPTGGGGQDVRKGPEEQDVFWLNRPFRRFLRVNGGRPILVASKEHVFDPALNRNVVKEVDEAMTDPSGRLVRVDEIVGQSWTGLMVPVGAAFICIDPFREHGSRLCYAGFDGYVTEQGNPLCNDCIERNDKNAVWSWLSFGVWNPQRY